MAEQVPMAGNADRPVISSAFAAARELLSQAEDDAAEVRAAADRYVRQREAEAELLVAKARRVLAAAEARSATMRRAADLPADDADHRSPATTSPEGGDEVIDLDALAGSPPVAAPASPARRPVRLVVDATRPSDADGFDGILASAVTHAVDRALTPDA